MMIPTVVGMLALMATLGGILVGLAAWLLGRWRRVPPLRRAGGWLAGGVAACYGVTWLLAVPFVEERHLAPGSEVSFCDVDCHLHVSVARVARGKTIEVTVAFRSDAKRADEYPGSLRFELVDREGRRWPPTAGFVTETLAAGGTLEREFQFSLADGASVKGLSVYRPGAIDYLLPGLGNPLVQRRFLLDL